MQPSLIGMQGQVVKKLAKYISRSGDDLGVSRGSPRLAKCLQAGQITVQRVRLRARYGAAGLSANFVSTTSDILMLTRSARLELSGAPICVPARLEPSSGYLNS